MSIWNSFNNGPNKAFNGIRNVFLSGPGNLSLGSIQIGTYVQAGITGSLIPPMPSDVKQGDLLIFRSSNAGTDAATQNAGWSRISAVDASCHISWIIVGANLPAAYQTTSGTRVAANITRYRLPKTPTLIGSTNNSNTAASSTASASGISITGNPKRVLIVAAANISTNDTTASNSFNASNITAASPKGVFATTDTNLKLQSKEWIAEGSIFAVRLGSGRSLHGFSWAGLGKRIQNSDTGTLSTNFLTSGATGMVALAFAY